MSCLRSISKDFQIDNSIKIEIIELPQQHILEQFWNAKPSWQNSFHAVERDVKNNICIVSYSGNQLTGYLIFAPSNYRIKQFGVNKTMRNKRIGKSLFSTLKTIVKDKEVSINNLTNNDEATLEFVTKLGLKKTVEQFEMYFTKKYNK